MWFSKLDWVCPAVAFNFQALLASFFLQYVWLAIFNGNIYIYCCSFLSSWGLSVSFIISSIPPNILNHYFAVLKNKKKIITKKEITPPFFGTGISFVSFFVEFWNQKHELHFLGLWMHAKCAHIYQFVNPIFFKGHFYICVCFLEMYSSVLNEIRFATCAKYLNQL